MYFLTICMFLCCEVKARPLNSLIFPVIFTTQLQTAPISFTFVKAAICVRCFVLSILGIRYYLANNNVFIILTCFVETTDNSLKVMSYMIFHVVEQCHKQLGTLETQMIHLCTACIMKQFGYLYSTFNSPVNNIFQYSRQYL